MSAMSFTASHLTVTKGFKQSLRAKVLEDLQDKHTVALFW